MGVALKSQPQGKKRALYEDFTPKAHDPYPVSVILARPDTTIDIILLAFGDAEFVAFQAYANRQKNMERVLEYMALQDRDLKTLEDRGRANFPM